MAYLLRTWKCSQGNPYNYKLPATTVAQQVEDLKSRGMKISPQGVSMLAHVNYSRLREYWQHLKKNPQEINSDFVAGTNIEQVIHCYEFDNSLRLLMMEAFSYIEISIRRQWSYQMAQVGGSHAYLCVDLFEPRFLQDGYEKYKKEIENTINKSTKGFVIYFLEKYNSPPPIWMVVELMSFGTLSICYSQTVLELRKKIGGQYKMSHKRLKSFLHSAAYIRNLCAHYTPLWRKELDISIFCPKESEAFLWGHDKVLYNNYTKNKIYNMLPLIIYMLNIIKPDNDWKQRLLLLLSDKDGDKFACHMGFPSDWRKMEYWQVNQ